jgi:hypothetical protein
MHKVSIDAAARIELNRLLDVALDQPGKPSGTDLICPLCWSPHLSSSRYLKTLAI